MTFRPKHVISHLSMTSRFVIEFSWTELVSTNPLPLVESKNDRYRRERGSRI